MTIFDLEASVMTAAHEFEFYTGKRPYGIVIEKDMMAFLDREYRKNIIVNFKGEVSAEIFGMVVFPVSKPGWSFYLTQEPTKIRIFPAVEPSGLIGGTSE